VHWVTGESYQAVPYAQAILSLATIALTALLTRRLFGRAAALLAAFAAAVCYVLVWQPVHFLSEVLYTPALLLAVLTLHRALERPSPRSFTGAGVRTRPGELRTPDAGFFPLVAWVAVALRGTTRPARLGVVYAVAALAVMAPWLIRNYVRVHAWFPLTYSNAILWQGSPEYYHLVRDSGYTYIRVWKEKIYPPNWREHDPMSVQGDRYWTARALRSIRAEPLTYLRYAAEKTVTYWVGDPEADWGGRHVFSYNGLVAHGYRRRSAIQLTFWRGAIFVALASMWVLRRRWRELLAIYAVMVYCTLLHAATHAEARLSEPLLPLLLTLIAGAFIAVLRGSSTDVHDLLVGAPANGPENSLSGQGC
jgi:4-amino-4-deoxy-L-arabinose transferase-like glycosyltransferase